MPRNYDRILTTLMVGCALLVTGFVVRRELVPPPPASAPARPVKVDDWQDLQSRGHRTGSADAPIQIVEFSDFQCPYCRKLALILDTLQARYPGKVAMLYRHFPISRIHPHARAAAFAVECAERQGRFREMHDALYRSQDSIGRLSWNAFAIRAEVPRQREFARCLADSATSSRITSDSAAAIKLGLRATPTLVINGWRVPSYSLSALDSIVKAELRDRR